ncbi:MAG: CdvA-like protein [Candidatus Bathyarchaeia archaeon]
MSSNLPEHALKVFLGKKTLDPYGRSLGVIIGLSLNDYGELEAVDIDNGNSEIHRIPMEQLTVTRDGIVIIPRWRVEVEATLREIDSAQRRINSLRLLKQNEVSKSLYDELLTRQESELAGLKMKKDKIMSILHSRCKELNMQIEELSKLLIEIKAGKWSKDFMDKAYEVASKSIEPNLEYASREKRDLTDYLAKLAKTLW